jgi:AbrB family looped-hinge helix DNA binding protein
MFMRRTKITSGGQISIPAPVRHRWGTSRVVIEDLGDSLVVRPAPEDPIAALRGAFSAAGEPSADELRARARAEDRAAEERHLRAYGRRS